MSTELAMPDKKAIDAAIRAVTRDCDKHGKGKQVADSCGALCELFPHYDRKERREKIGPGLVGAPPLRGALVSLIRNLTRFILPHTRRKESVNDTADLIADLLIAYQIDLLANTHTIRKLIGRVAYGGWERRWVQEPWRPRLGEKPLSDRTKAAIANIPKRVRKSHKQLPKREKAEIDHENFVLASLVRERNRRL